LLGREDGDPTTEARLPEFERQQPR
jgi:hypothetical protein